MPADRANSDPALLKETEKLQAQVAVLQKELQAERTTNSILGEDLADAEAQLRTLQANNGSNRAAEKASTAVASNGSNSTSDPSEVDFLKKQLSALESELAAMDADLHAKDEEIRTLTAANAGMTPIPSTGTPVKPKIDSTIIVDANHPDTTAAPPSGSNSSPPLSPRGLSHASSVALASADSIPTAKVKETDQSAVILSLKHEILEQEDQVRELKFQLSQREAKEKKAAAKEGTVAKLEAKVKALEKELAGVKASLETERTSSSKLLASHATKLAQLESEHKSALHAAQQTHAAELAQRKDQQEHDLAEARAASAASVSDLTARVAELEAVIVSMESRVTAASHEEALGALQMMHDQELVVLHEQLAKAEKAAKTSPSEPSASAAHTAELEKLQKELNSVRVILSAQVQQHIDDEAAMESMHAELMTTLEDLKHTQEREATLQHQTTVLEAARSDLAERNLLLSSELSRSLIFSQDLESTVSSLREALSTSQAAKKLLEEEADARVEADLVRGEEEGRKEEERAKEKALVEELRSQLATQQAKLEEERLKGESHWHSEREALLADRERERTQEKEERAKDAKKMQDELTKQMATSSNIASLLTAQTSSFLELQRVHAQCGAPSSASPTQVSAAELDSNSEAETAMLRVSNAKLLQRVAELEETLLFGPSRRESAASTLSVEVSNGHATPARTTPTPDADLAHITPNKSRGSEIAALTPEGLGGSPATAAPPTASPAAATPTRPTHARKSSGLKLPTKVNVATASPASVAKSKPRAGTLQKAIAK